MGATSSIFYPPEDIETAKPRTDLAIAASEGRCEEEGWQIRKDGSRFWASGVIFPMRDSQGQLQGYARITRDTTRRRLADQALRERHRSLQHILAVSPVVLCVHDVRQKRNVYVNRGAAAALGYAVGQESQNGDFLRSAMHSDDWPQYLDHLQRLAGLGDEETAEFEYRLRHSNGSWRWFQSRDRVFTRSADGAVREIIAAASDITERKSAEERARFLADLNDTLMPLGDPEQIMAVAVRMLGQHLKVDRCGYAEVHGDEDQFVVMGEYTRGAAPSIVGKYRMSEFGENEQRVLGANRAYVVHDIETDTPEGADLDLYRRGAIRALVCVPLKKTGNFVARMAVHQSTARHWSDEEIKLIITVADRCWESVERARALRSLKESDERYRAFIANSSEAIWRFELEQPIPVDSSYGRAGRADVPVRISRRMQRRDGADVRL